ncbi:C-terminal binding protein [Paenibacillus spongiae]|uniref:C-terminal binding protein n=1 Tax=Paenibacillus spongiae TaxID=2909671 RepID=A0ABY5SG69_9BACL|nr:C-terminal binding protein [Paenibacillus spongiae]UVI32972.1 C-terminal binding protein [Paenibacillus spongiae]
MKIVYLNTNYEDSHIEEKHIHAAGMQLHVHNGLKPSEFAPAVEDADALVVALEKVDRNLLDGMPKLRVIGRMGVGIDSVDIEAASKRGIPVINVPDYCIEEVALQAVSMILAAHRKLVPAQTIVKDGRWDNNELKPIQALSGLTLGLIGMGRIGNKVIEYMRAFGLRIAVSDPFLRADQVPTGVELLSFEELLKEADILSIHCPLTPETKHIINRDTLALMKKQPIIVNVSRGGMINEQDLAEGLDNGQIRYAALDVLNQEPPDIGHPLIHHPKALITNHIAWYSVEAEIRLREMSVTRVIDYLEGRPVPTIVNAKGLEALK